MDTAAASVKAELDRYTNYYSRYANFQTNQKAALAKRGDIAKLIIKCRIETGKSLDYIADGLDLLVNCRHTLKFFYVYQYYHEKETSTQLILEQKTLAEHFTEVLADFVFKKIPKQSKPKRSRITSV